MTEDASIPAVAVVMPVFNRLELLRVTVASLRAQTLTSAEFLIVDDGSDLPTATYLDALPQQDPRFRILRKPEGAQRGCQASRDFGLAACCAAAVVFLDSDDLLAPECLERRLRELERHPEADLVVGHQAMFWEDGPGRVKKLRWVNVPNSARADLDRCLDLLDPLDVPWVNGGVMIRCDRLRACGAVWSVGFHWDDLAFHFACLAGGLQALWMDYAGALPDAYYRKHGGEHYGSILQTAEGTRNTASMIGWMKQELESSGAWSRERHSALARSYFHVCILSPIDRGDHALAAELIAYGDWLGTGERRRFRTYARGRRLCAGSPRATYFWNRLARRCYLKEFFSGTPWTYGSESPPEAESRDALNKLLGSRAGVSSATP